MDDLTTQQILDLLTECSEMGAANFHVFGGEPFLRDDLEEIFTYANDLKFQLSVATNGTLLRQKDFQWIHQLNPFLGITLHGPKEFHDSFCEMDGGYDRTLQTLHTALKMKLNVGVITCVTRLNYTTYFTWMQSLVNAGIRTFFVIYFSPLGRGKEQNLQLSNAEWRALHQTLNNYVLNSPVRLNIYFELSLIPKIPYLLYQKPPVLSCALFSKSNCVVDANQDVYPCILFLRNPQYKLGNFALNSLHEIWSRYQPGTREKPKACEKCENFWICNGGCPAYYRDGLDFRCDGKHIPLCPLFTDQL